jgi:DNA-binding MarR family transcriptional regulator
MNAAAKFKSAKTIHTARKLDQSPLLGLLGYNVRRTDLCLNQAFRRQITEVYKLKPVEFSILTLITRNHDVTHKELGHALDVAGPNLALIIAGMQKRKLVVRRPNPADGRSMHLEASPKGLALLKATTVAVDAMEAALTKNLTAPERNMLFRIMAQLHRVGES